jgi:hypothetical protein
MALAPAPAMAQHGGHGGVHAAGFSGGFRGGGFRGGGFRGFRGNGFFFGDAFLGFALGAAIADSWYWDYPDYYGYLGPYGVEPYDDYGPPPPYAYGPDGPPPPQGQAPQGQAPQPQACGSWTWDAAQSRYNWAAC